MKKMNNLNARIISFCVLCLFAAMVISITACTNGNQDAERDINGTMNIDFGENGVIRNGTEYASYPLEKGQKGIISIDISKVSGRLDLDVYPVDDEEKPEYTGRDLDSASFDVVVEKSGEYMVCFTAADFVGEYGISWRTEEVRK